MIYLFDTNILLHYLRGTSVAKRVEAEFAPFHPSNTLLLSIASFGEIRSIAIQHNWGKRRLNQLETEMTEFAIIPVRARDIVERYAEIDAFSQGKFQGKPLGLSARNMGKNDLWIAATGSILGATLLTTDADFDHLNSVFLTVEKVEV